MFIFQDLENNFENGKKIKKFTLTGMATVAGSKTSIN